MAAQSGLQARLRGLPAVHEVDAWLKAAGLPHGRAVRSVVLGVLERLRQEVQAAAGPAPAHEAAFARVEQALRDAQQEGLQAVINATGVVVHTNLGRAPLAQAWLQDSVELLSRYQNLELDLHSGRRGLRGGRAAALLAQLAGAQSALVVNNNAAAVLLLLTALAQGGQVIVSRGELVEIGGGFRVPEIMRQSGCTLVEVGTTNRTRIQDYAQALAACTQPAALLKVHRSNFTMQGFVEEASLEALAALARQHSLPLWYDAGAGSFHRFHSPPLHHIPTIAQELAQGCHVLTFSGDKTLGAVQAGLVAGRQESIRRMAAHPLYRALRMDKVRLVLLERALLECLAPASATRHNPTQALLERPLEDLHQAATRITQALEQGLGRTSPLRWERIQAASLPGGGAHPEASLPSICLALQWQPAAQQNPQNTSLADLLRQNTPPIIARQHQGRTLLDLRTLLPGDETLLIKALLRIALFE